MSPPKNLMPDIEQHSTPFVRTSLHCVERKPKSNNGCGFFGRYVGKGTLRPHFGHLPTVMRNFLIWVKAGQGTHT